MMKRLLEPALCLTFGLIGCSVAQAQNWPTFRGQNGTGVGDGNNPPTTWNVEKSLNISWKSAIPGLGHSSPINLERSNLRYDCDQQRREFRVCAWAD